MTSQFTTLNHPTLPTEAAARLVWAYLVEPGDEVAGTFTTIFGAAEALDLLEHAKNAPHFVTTVHSQDRDSARQHSSVTPQALRAAYERWILRLNNFQAREYFEKSSHSDFQIVTPEHQLWPPQLRDLGYAAPHALWIRGSVWATHQPAVAVVGARAVTAYGREVTAHLSYEACQLGHGVVSGAAFGVDAVAHNTALRAATTPTVAVLAGGIDKPYPRAHSELLTQITTNGGAVCSEVPPGTAPTRWRFLQRNRLIAAFAHTTIVTEAGYRSGAVNTAAHTAQIGRNLGAVPGRIDAPNSQGCFRIIKEYGADMITDVHDLQNLIGTAVEPDLPAPAASSSGSPGAATPPRELSIHTRVLDAIPLRESATETELAQTSGLSERELRNALAELQLLGKVVKHHKNSNPSWAHPKRNESLRH